MVKVTSKNQVTHYGTVPCGSNSIFGVSRTNDREEVTCKSCLRCIKVDTRRRSKYEGHGKGKNKCSEGSFN